MYNISAVIHKHRNYLEQINQNASFIQNYKRLKLVGFNENLNRPVVFNHDLLNLTDDSAISHIIVADNPGKEELVQGRYLVGPAGRKARHFFEQVLEVNFQSSVIVLNKTPLYTPTTDKLKEIRMMNSELFTQLQVHMASLCGKLIRLYPKTELWIIGTSNIGTQPSKIFHSFTEAIRKVFTNSPEFRERTFLFKHFSRNWFQKDYDACKTIESAQDCLHNIGRNSLFSER